jgi:hypothetical protein
MEGQPMSEQDERTAPASRRRLSPLQISLRGMALVVVCCAAVMWSTRRYQELQHPAFKWLQALRSNVVGERREAAKYLLQSEPGDFEIAAAALVHALEDRDAVVREEAARSLGVMVSGMLRTGSSRETIDPAVKALIKLLLEREPANRGVETKQSADPGAMAARELGEIAPRTPWAELAVVSLTEALCDPGDGPRQQAAARALGRFGPEAERSLGDLKRRLGEAAARGGVAHSDEWRSIAAEAIARIAPGTKSASEAIFALTEPLRLRADKATQAEAMKVLNRLGPLAHEAVPVLIAIMKEVRSPAGRPGAHQWVPEALGKIAPSSPSAQEAITALSETLRGEPDGLSDNALLALTRFGAEARSAVPRIEAFAASNPNHRSFAESVLKAIDPGR